MRKLFFTAIVALLFCSAAAQAQNCESIVTPLLEQMGTTKDYYPAEKIEHFCTFSHQAFYLTDKVPDASLVYDITDLTQWGTDGHPAADMVIDLSTLSFWRYNFQNFQKVDRTVYFRLGRGNSHKYLALRSYNETSILTEQAEYGQPKK